MELLAAAIALIIIYLCYIFFRPLQYERPLPPLNENRRIGQHPPPYPDSWFRICWSSELSRNKKPLSVAAFGRQILISRSTTNAQLHVVEACCATQQQQEAPFDCSAHRPHRFPVEELLGMVLIWHSTCSSKQPTWRIPPILRDLAARQLSYHGQTQHYVGCHIQDMAENGPDSTHLSFLHRPFMFSFPPAATHRWENVTWKLDPNEPHRTHITLSQSAEWMGLSLPLTKVSVDIYQIGIGVVLIDYHLPAAVMRLLGAATRFYMIESVTPVSPLVQRAGHIGWGVRVPRPIAKLILYGSISQFERDIPIWSKKTFVHPPLVVKGDGPILQYRRWAAQFYTTAAAET